MMKDFESGIEVFNRGLSPPLKDRALLKRVFTHSSFLNEPGGGGLESNERLEFLGDAVLGAAAAHMLYLKFPDVSEGELTRLRARLVNRRALAGLSRELGLDRLLLLGKGEARAGGAENARNLAGVFEALLGAIYLEAGFKKTMAYTAALFSPLMDGVKKGPGWFDYKPELQELTQRFFKTHPRYSVTKDSGRPHAKTFEVEVRVGSRVLARGTGTRIKDAEQAAAKKALEEVKKAFPSGEKDASGSSGK
ncbi:MAG: ribonuclease III [Thermodesulfobacteriota bacterium]